MIRQRVDILLLQLVDFDGLSNLVFFRYLLVSLRFLTVRKNKSLHMGFDVGLIDDLYDTGSFDLVLNQQEIDEVFHTLAVRIRNWLLFVLDYLENQPEQVFSMERVFESAELVEDTAKGPDI